jgi:integrase
MAHVALTVRAIKEATCPPDKERVKLPVAGHSNLYLQVHRTGHKVFWDFYRAGSGRQAPQRWYRIGDANVLPPRVVHEIWLANHSAVAKGQDPVGDRRSEAKRGRRQLGTVLDAYEADLERRHVVNRREYLSLLRREMLAPMGNIDLQEIDRATFAEQVRRVEADGRSGAAKELKIRASVLLSWAVDQGLITANPLAGWRRTRRTRAERLDRPGRALGDWELPILWRAAEARGWPFGPYLQMLLLLGQRRTETALMGWSDVDLQAGLWIVPAKVTKSGRLHKVPLPSQVTAILANLPRQAHSDLVFPGDRGGVMSGWSTRIAPVYEATAKAGMAAWTLHDLRRTMRSGLGRLGVDRVIAELLLNHAISDELIAIYDRAQYQVQRAEAAARWANHVTGVLAAVDAVVPFSVVSA